MMTRAGLLVLINILVAGNRAAAGPPEPSWPVAHIIDRTVLVGTIDVVLWTRVLAALPDRPARIQVLDLDGLSPATRDKLRGIDGFVLHDQTTIVVVQQGETLRRAAAGDDLDRLVLASLVWHEMAHAGGLDEPAAFKREQALWRQFVAKGLVRTEVGLAYVARLDAANRESGRAHLDERSLLARAR